MCFTHVYSRVGRRNIKTVNSLSPPNFRDIACLVTKIMLRFILPQKLSEEIKIIHLPERE